MRMRFFPFGLPHELSLLSARSSRQTTTTNGSGSRKVTVDMGSGNMTTVVKFEPEDWVEAKEAFESTRKWTKEIRKLHKAIDVLSATLYKMIQVALDPSTGTSGPVSRHLSERLKAIETGLSVRREYYKFEERLGRDVKEHREEYMKSFYESHSDVLDGVMRSASDWVETKYHLDTSSIFTRRAFVEPQEAKAEMLTKKFA